MKLFKFTTGAAAFALLSFTSVSAWAVPTLSFTNTPTTGTLSYDGVGGPLIVDNVGFTSIQFTGTPPAGNGNSLICNSCLLSFTTGDNINEAIGLGNSYTFEDGGSFTLTGTANDGSGNIGAANSTLLGGSFTGTPSAEIVAGSTGQLEAVGTNTISSPILDYFGIGASSFTFDLRLLATASQQPDRGLDNGRVGNASLSVTAVPEPAQIAMFLFGAGLIGGGLWLRRKPQVLHNAV